MNEMSSVSGDRDHFEKKNALMDIKANSPSHMLFCSTVLECVQTIKHTHT